MATTKTKKVTKAKTEKFDYKTIKTFEDACNLLGISPCGFTDLGDEFRKPIMAAYKLMIIFKAINNGWTPDWSNDDQYKYYPWFGVLSSGFGFSYSTYDYTDSHAGVGSRLCTDTSEKALYIATQFKAEYKDFLLYSE